MQKLTLEALDSRMQSHAKEMLTFTFGVMKSITLGIASLVFYQLCAAIWHGDLGALMRVPAWAASFCVAWLTYNNVSVFSNLTRYDTRGADIFFLFVKTPIEMLLFLVLQTQAGWYAWPLLYGAITGISHLKIKRFMEVLDPYGYDPVLHPLLRVIREWAEKTDLPATRLSFFLLSISSITSLLLFRLNIISSKSMTMFALLASVLSFIPLGFAVQTGDKIRKEILKVLKENHREPLSVGRAA